MTKVPITSSLLAAVGKSNQKYNDELKKEQKVINKAAKATAEEAEVARKRKAEEADLQTWKGKKVDLQENIAASEAFIHSQENVVKEALQRSLGLKSRDAMKTSVMTAEMGRQAIVKEQTKLKKLQEALVLHVGKKPKMV